MVSYFFTNLDNEKTYSIVMQVFFRAGVLGQLEEMRDARLAKILSLLQAQCRGFLMRKEYKKMLDKRVGLLVLQRNIRKYLVLRVWPWWRLYTKVSCFQTTMLLMKSCSSFMIGIYYSDFHIWLYIYIYRLPSIN